jgi:hypothetical protein
VNGIARGEEAVRLPECVPLFVSQLEECDMMREKSIPYLPTADEIRATSRQIRSGWSPRERESRCGGERATRKLVAIRRLMFDVERRFGAT